MALFYCRSVSYGAQWKISNKGTQCKCSAQLATPQLSEPRAHSHGNIIKSSAAMWQLSYVFQWNGHSNVDLNKYACPIHSNSDMWSCGWEHSVQCRNSVQQKWAAWSLWVFSKPTSGDLERGRSGRREEAGRVRASRGSFPVYTGGINGKQQGKKWMCAHLPKASRIIAHVHTLTQSSQILAPSCRS